MEAATDESNPKNTNNKMGERGSNSKCVDSKANTMANGADKQIEHSKEDSQLSSSETNDEQEESSQEELFEFSSSDLSDIESVDMAISDKSASAEFNGNNENDDENSERVECIKQVDNSEHVDSNERVQIEETIENNVNIENNTRADVINNNNLVDKDAQHSSTENGNDGGDVTDEDHVVTSTPKKVNASDTEVDGGDAHADVTLTMENPIENALLTTPDSPSNLDDSNNSLASEDGNAICHFLGMANEIVGFVN